MSDATKTVKEALDIVAQKTINAGLKYSERHTDMNTVSKNF